jgi:hypothetical protein
VHLGVHKIIVVNLIVFCSLFLSLEFASRVWLYFWKCDTACYDTAYLTKLDAFTRNISKNRAYGFLTADPITGYSPGDGTFVIREWNDATITIRQGVRLNPNFTPPSADGAILAVGDSFVFGDEVSDNETWPAILEQRINRRVVNGGVSGYGTAQAVLRAAQLLKTEPYSLVILSILVPFDLWRDRDVTGIGGFYRPVVIRQDGGLYQTTAEESRRVVSDNFVCAHPWIPELFFWSYIAKRFFSRVGYDGRCTNLTHPKVATVEEVLEFAVGRLAAFPVNTAILMQYQRVSFVQAGKALGDYIRAANAGRRMIREAANRHGVPVIDTYDALNSEPLRETYNDGSWSHHSKRGNDGSWSHHSKRGNEIVADLIASSDKSIVVPNCWLQPRRRGGMYCEQGSAGGIGLR